MRTRRGAAGIAAVIALVILQLAVVGMVVSGTRHHDLTVHRLDSVRAVYAAEAGMNMAVRELVLNSDHDGDGTVGSISNDGDAANDPALGVAQVYVTRTITAGQTLVVSLGRCGGARTRIESTLE